jgi:hypothetical protein
MLNKEINLNFDTEQMLEEIKEKLNNRPLNDLTIKNL